MSSNSQGLVANQEYCKPLTISPGLIFFWKQFLMGLYRGGGVIYRGLIQYMGAPFSLVLVYNKQVSHKQENKYVLITHFE